MNVCVYGASSNDIDRSYIEETEYLGREIAKRGHTLVYGAGANGLMGAVARGVYEENGTIIGVTPSFFNVDGILFENVSELITTETMRERKQIMEDKADAFIITPGGIGTLEEFFEDPHAQAARTSRQSNRNFQSERILRSSSVHAQRDVGQRLYDAWRPTRYIPSWIIQMRSLTILKATRQT